MEFFVLACLITIVECLIPLSIKDKYLKAIFNVAGALMCFILIMFLAYFGLP